MNANIKSKEFLTLSEARDAFIDPKRIEDVVKTSQAITSFEDAARDRFGPRRSGWVFMEDPHPDPHRSPHYKSLKQAHSNAIAKANRQFYDRLAKCHLTARKGDPTEDLKAIPVSAIPDGIHRHGRLRVYNWSASMLVSGFQENEILYYDIRVIQPDEQEQTCSQRRNVSNVALRAFLSNYVEAREPGNPELTQERLWQAARNHFPRNHVSRQQVRYWISENMSPTKRFARGRKPVTA